MHKVHHAAWEVWVYFLEVPVAPLPSFAQSLWQSNLARENSRLQMMVHIILVLYIYTCIYTAYETYSSPLRTSHFPFSITGRFLSRRRLVAAAVLSATLRSLDVTANAQHGEHDWMEVLVRMASGYPTNGIQWVDRKAPWKAGWSFYFSRTSVGVVHGLGGPHFDRISWLRGSQSTAERSQS